jgi:integrase
MDTAFCMQTVITTRTINTIKPGDKPIEIRDTQLKGLLLRIQPSGVMTYYVEYKRGKRIKVGRADAITPFEAREIARGHLAESFKGGDPGDKRRLSKTKTYKQFLNEDYRAWLKHNLKSADMTHDRLELAFPEFHKLKLHEITPWLAEKWKQRRQKDGVKPTTINRELADLKACLARALQWGIIEKHPLEHFKLCKVDHSPKVRYLSPEEESRIREALDTRELKLRQARESANRHRQERGYPLYPDLSATAFADYLKPVVLLSLNTGLRRGELFALRWDDIDFSQRTLSVMAENAKSGKTRHIPLNDEAYSVLKGWKEQSQTVKGFIFEGKDGQPIHDVRTSWATLLSKEQANVEGFRWHDLRHTFASKLVMAGVDLNTVRELLGHTDYKMTLRYAHLAPEHKAMAVNKLVQGAI